MNKKILTIVIASLTIAIVGVATATTVFFLFPYQPNQPPQVDDTGSTQQGIQKVVNANNQFAFELYSELNKTEDGNIFYSPYSISTALAMTYEGAKGQTANEIKSVFHFPESNILRANSAAIYNEINKKDKPYKLSTGNALWAQYDYTFLKEYINRVEQFYGGKIANVDFKQPKEREESRQTINVFIEKQTNNKIKNLIPKGVLTNLTKLILTNAIYFKGTWEWEFDKTKTSEQNFKITPQKTVKSQMMRMDPDKIEFNYANLEKLQILELPYKGNELSMLILLPKQGKSYKTGNATTYNYTLKDIDLSLEKLKEYKAQMRKTKLDAIYLPKFEFDSKYFMKNTLSAMGMPTAFTFKADLSGMDDTDGLYINDVIHQAYVKIDEQGTEATAATAVVIELKSAMQINTFRADHPFIFIIQQKNTGNILFMGRVTDPTKQ